MYCTTIILQVVKADFKPQIIEIIAGKANSSHTYNYIGLGFLHSG